jgi:hypothetical protein
MREMIGLRLKLTFGNPDPGYPEFIQVPADPLVGTIIKKYTGVHRRPSYYVRLDKELELRISDPHPRLGTGSIRILHDTKHNIPQSDLIRASCIVSICQADDTTDPPRDLLAEQLLSADHGHAGLAYLVLDGDLPDDFTLAQAQEQQHIPLPQQHQTYLGYADIEVVD